MPLPAYEQVLKAAHTFNLLDARGAISVTERAAYIGRIRTLARERRAGLSRQSRERLGFPMAPRAWADEVLAQLAKKAACMSTTNLLVELLAEELPPKALTKLGEAFAASDRSRPAGRTACSTADSARDAVSPRRAAWRCMLPALPAKAAGHAGAAKADAGRASALDAAGKPTPALLKKLAALGPMRRSCRRSSASMDGKAEYLFLRQHGHGRDARRRSADGAGRGAEQTADPQGDDATSWRDGWSSVNFVRPVHGLIAAARQRRRAGAACSASTPAATTQGHRFMRAGADRASADADAYASTLESEGTVIASFAARRADHRDAARCRGRERRRCSRCEDDALLDEVTALVERPERADAASFEPEFLDVPQECLILTMKANQKYFPLLDATAS